MKCLFILPVVLLSVAAATAQTRTNASVVVPVRRTEMAKAPVPPAPILTNMALSAAVQRMISARQSPAMAQGVAAPAGKKLAEAKPDPFFLQELPELEFAPAKANEATLGTRPVSGLAVQAVKTKHPLQLLNPWAPARYGSGSDNLDERSSGITGPALKIFAIDF